MPPRTIPKIHQVALRTHKLSIYLTVLPSTLVSALKDDALSALCSGVGTLRRDSREDITEDDIEEDDEIMLNPKNSDDNSKIPHIESTNDFELCRAVKERGRSTGAYETLDPARDLRDCGFGPWEVLFIQFRGVGGQLLPVKCSIPSVDDDDDEIQVPVEVPPVNKGKRKARSDEERP